MKYMQKNKFIVLFIGALLVIILIWINLSKDTKQPPSVNETSQATQEIELATMPTSAEITVQPSQENKLCSWVDDSDIVIKLNFAEGVVKDTAYEAGFYYSTIGSDMRLARSACDYRTGFSYSEMKNKGAVQVGVRGFSDSTRRQLKDEPINVVFDENGKPSLPSPIEVQVMN